MNAKTIFNPLFDERPAQVAVASSEGMEDGKPMTATAAIYNQTQGQCPKCKTQMTTATLANADAVYFCERCCVSMPLTNE